MVNKNKYQVIIGLEVHVQLQTNTKLFCGDSARFGAEPNTQVSAVSLAHPGALPALNKKAIEYAVKLGLALNCNIEEHNYFARKNYFYPDLPKGYQVSQHTAPICNKGFVKINTVEGERDIKLNRIHLEEDAGKSIHDADENFTCIDLNRAGVPLLEIVSEPDMHSSEEAFAYLTNLRKLVRWLGICDGNMEEGSMRCDANISIRLTGETALGTRVEVKNLNSISNVKKAIELETARLINLAENNETIIQETRSFDADKNVSFSLRSKEDADDYRYFPEPDLPPFVVSKQYINEIKTLLPALPEALQKKYITEFALSEYDASVICNDKETVAFFEGLITDTNNYKAAANWLLGPIRSYCNEKNIDASNFPLQPAVIASLIELTEEGKISFNNASSKILYYLIAFPGKTPIEAAIDLNLLQENNTESISDWVDEVFLKMPEKIKEYKSGKKNLLGLFAGEVKKASKGKADMQLVNEILLKKLNA